MLIQTDFVPGFLLVGQISTMFDRLGIKRPQSNTGEGGTDCIVFFILKKDHTFWNIYLVLSNYIEKTFYPSSNNDAAYNGAPVRYYDKKRQQGKSHNSAV
jgi:hypothetical protein